MTTVNYPVKTLSRDQLADIKALQRLGVEVVPDLKKRCARVVVTYRCNGWTHINKYKPQYFSAAKVFADLTLH